MADIIDFRVKNGLVVTTTAAVLGTTSSLSTLTGALVVAGGVGIGQNLYVGGGTQVTGRFTSTGIANVTNTTNATSTTTGALVVAGGVGIGRDVWIGGSLNIAGGISATVSGTITTATTVSIANDTATSTTHFLTFASTSSSSPQGSQLKINAAELSFVPSTGNLGVGTTSPGQKLEVFGSLRLRGTTNNFGDLSYNTNGYIGTDASNGLRSGSGRFFGSGSPNNGYLQIDSYGSVLQAATLANGSSTVLELSVAPYNPTLAGYTKVLFSAPGTLNATSATTFRGVQTVLIDTSTAVANTVVGVYSDVSGGANTASNRYSGVFLGGNVGVGTETPGTRLHVVSSDTTVYDFASQTISASDVLRLENPDQTVTGYTGIYLQHKSNNVAMARIALRGSFFDSETAALTFGLRPMSGGGRTVERMRITADGNVAIGTTVTNSVFTVAGSAQISGITTITNTTAATSTITGALVVTGGVGIGRDLWVGAGVYAITKSFLIDHPTKPGMKLRYGSLESPYHGVRLTGEAVLVDKICRVELPEYIRALCKQEGAQVQLTNVKHGKVLWVEDLVINENYFTVACDRGFFDKKEYKFYWSLTAIRKDIDSLEVEIAV